MKLTNAAVLEGVIDALRDQIAPGLSDPFTIDAARMAGSLIAIAGRAGEDAAAIRVEENARMRAIFAEAVEVVADSDLVVRLREAAESSDPGLRIGELDSEVGRLRALLVELHAWLEVQSDPGARRLDQAIWRAIRDAEMARAPRG
ncbi:MAG: hypothetical protein AB7F98_18595 [Novosphingobium sp.]